MHDFDWFVLFFSNKAGGRFWLWFAFLFFVVGLCCSPFVLKLLLGHTISPAHGFPTLQLMVGQQRQESEKNNEITFEMAGDTVVAKCGSLLFMPLGSGRGQETWWSSLGFALGTFFATNLCMCFTFILFSHFSKHVPGHPRNAGWDGGKLHEWDAWTNEENLFFWNWTTIFYCKEFLLQRNFYCKELFLANNFISSQITSGTTTKIWTRWSPQSPTTWKWKCWACSRITFRRVFKKLLVGLLAKMCQQMSKMLRTGNSLKSLRLLLGNCLQGQICCLGDHAMSALFFWNFVVNPGESEECRIPDDLRKFGSWLQRGCELQPQAKQGQTKFECLLWFCPFLGQPAVTPLPGGWTSTCGKSNLNCFSNFDHMIFLKVMFLAGLVSYVFTFQPPTRSYIWRISWRLDSRLLRNLWKSDVWCFAQVVKNHKGPHPLSESSSLKHPHGGMGSILRRCTTWHSLIFPNLEDWQFLTLTKLPSLFCRCSEWMKTTATWPCITHQLVRISIVL